MGYIAKERGRYRVRFAIRSAAFIRRRSSARARPIGISREVDANEFRGQWVDPRDAQMPLAAWAEAIRPRHQLGASKQPPH